MQTCCATGPGVEAGVRHHVLGRHRSPQGGHGRGCARSREHWAPVGTAGPASAPRALSRLGGQPVDLTSTYYTVSTGKGIGVLTVFQTLPWNTVRASCGTGCPHSLTLAAMGRRSLSAGAVSSTGRIRRSSLSASAANAAGRTPAGSSAQAQ